MGPSFNLVDEPWLPIIWADGRAGQVGFRDALVRAHEIRELVDGSPLVTVSLHRLLLAILHRTVGPPDFEAWKTLWRRGRWDADVMDAYFARWRHRFDLFDAERPFCQVARHDDDAKLHPPALLAQELSSGNNPTVFDHNVAERPRPIEAAAAARLLAARQAFSVGGGVSRPFNLSHAPLTTGFTVLALGGSLFETLALNLTEYHAAPSTDPPDEPAWEQDAPATPDKDGTRPRGRVDYLTWQSRRIKLAANDARQVIGCQLAQNLKVHADVLDPFKSYTRHKDLGWVPRRLDPDRAVWRDSAAIVQRSNDDARRPDVFNWLARVDEAREDGEIDADPAYPMAVLGLGREATAKAADVSIWRHERFILPLAYLHEPELLGRLEDALKLAEDVGRLLCPGRHDILANEKRISVPRPFQVLAESLLPAIGDRADRKKVDAIVEHLAPERAYWSRLEVPFRQLLLALPADRDPRTGDYGLRQLPAWAGLLGRAAWDAFGEATNGLDRSARALAGVAKAEHELRRRLHDLLAPYLQQQQGVPA